MHNIANYIDHTILSPTCTAQQIQVLCEEALAHNFAAVCVPPYYVKIAKQQLVGTDIKVATVIGFPFGYSTTAAKINEIHQAIEDGADELDMVHNLLAVKNNDWEYLEKEITQCLQPIRLHNKTIKVIIESGILSNQEIIDSCKLYAKHKVDFVKTSTGYAATGAVLEHVQLMRANLPEAINIKASGGIKTYAAAASFIVAGASRLGTSSSIQIINEAAQQ